MSNEASNPADDATDEASPNRQLPRKKRGPQGPLGAIWRLFTSFGLAVTVLVLMTILTLFGTLEQADAKAAARAKQDKSKCIFGL